VRIRFTPTPAQLTPTAMEELARLFAEAHDHSAQDPLVLTKVSYYETLERSSQRWHEGQHDVFPWLEYFWGVLLRAYREFEQRVNQIRSGRGAKSEQVRDAVMSRREPFSISEIEAACAGVSRDTVRLVFRQLKAEGGIVPMGKGRGTKWVRKT
jgi:Fic family protein